MFKYWYFFSLSFIFICMPIFLVWLHEREFRFKKDLALLFVATLMPLLFILTPENMIAVRWVNFLQHSVGGGVAVGLVAIYFIENLKNKYPFLDYFLVRLVFVYALVSMLGVANELMEFSLDTMKIGIFSADRYDTWFDLLANSVGAVGVYVLYSFFEKIYSKTSGMNS